MTSVQLHIAKLRFPERNANWALVWCEKDELEETLVAVEELREVKNGVTLTPVLQSVAGTRLRAIGDAVTCRDGHAFASGYDALLAACNGSRRANPSSTSGGRRQSERLT